MQCIDLWNNNTYNAITMILSYKVKNFYSIGKDGATVNFLVDGNAPKTDLYISVGKKTSTNRASLIETVIGPNASGKTRLLQGLAFMKHLISYSYQATPNIPLSPSWFEPHRNSAKANSEISCRFTISNRLFEYSLVFNSLIILEEKIKEYSLTNKRITAKNIASRKWNIKDKKYIFTDKCLGITSAIELRKNASMIASAMHKDEPTELTKLISDYWTNNVIFYNLCCFGNAEDTNNYLSNNYNNSVKKLLDPKNSKIKDAVKDILSQYDIGFNDFYSKEFEIPNKGKLSIFGAVHKFEDKKFNILLDEESSGTKRLISILSDILTALAVKSGGIAIIDEIDAFLHPDIVEALVNLFVYPETNPNHAQILFSTHDHRLLESLDRQQIILTEKNKFGETESWRLDEMKDVKSTDNYYIKYITGAYGGRPKIGMSL